MPLYRSGRNLSDRGFESPASSLKEKLEQAVDDLVWEKVQEALTYNEERKLHRAAGNRLREEVSRLIRKLYARM